MRNFERLGWFNIVGADLASKIALGYAVDIEVPWMDASRSGAGRWESQQPDPLMRGPMAPVDSSLASGESCAGLCRCRSAAVFLGSGPTDLGARAG